MIEDAKYRKTIALEGTTYSLGRHPSNNIVINSHKASRKHATLIRKRDSKTNKDSYWILDGDLEGNKSLNGIFVNGTKCLVKELKHGDLINFGCDVNATYHAISDWSDTVIDIEYLKPAQQKTTFVLADAKLEQADSESEKEVLTSERGANKDTFVAQSYHDSLTDLPNRTLFREHLSIALSNAKRNQNPIAILLLDLESFAKVNETFGYAVGDQLLQDVAKRLKSCFRAGDIVARWGGDEFTVLLPQIKSSKDTDIVAQRILNTLKQPFEVEQHQINLKINLGVAVYPEDGDDMQTLWLKVESDLKSHRQENPSNPLAIAHSKAQAANVQISKVESRLNQALERNEFVLYYQPQVNIKTGEIYGMEALMRWKHPQRGLVYPGQFIPLAEQTDVILPISQWAIKTACEQNQAWQQQGLPPLMVSVNLSPRQFQNPNLGNIIAQVLEQTGLEPHLLELEITESSLLENLDVARHTFHELQQMGVHLCMDDFGMGYSSLNYLQQFAFHTLKIGQDCIHELIDNPQNFTLISALIAVGKSLNLRIVAEGVETQQQLEVLRRLECDKMQGDRFSKPLSASEATKFLSLHCTKFV
jgi:diguanylate cyclase (GGDEF)-like protein